MVFLSSLVTSLFQESDSGGAPWWLLGWLIAVGLIAWLISWLMQRASVADAPPADGVSAQAITAEVESTEPAAAETEMEHALTGAADDMALDEAASADDSASADDTAEPTEAEVVAAGAALDEAEALPETAARQDDLTRIEGVGPKVAGILKENGIVSYNQLAHADVEKLAEMLREAKLPMLHPATWPEQARLAAMADWDKLSAFQDDLKGGRKAE